MRRPRDVALRAGFYIAAALSGIAAAYVFNEWVLPYWAAQHQAPVLPDNPEDQASCPSPQDGSLKTDHAHPTDEVPAPVTDSEHTHPPPSPNKDVSQTKTLPPLQTHSLPPPLPSGPALLSGSYLSVNADSMTSSTTSLHTSSGEESVDDGSQANTSDTEPFVDVLSPPLAHVISRRRSMRVHDMFAESHISFADLGNLVAPQDDPK